uniref:Putative conserved plasma membrane protein n=1 Tax=Lutzomyia longipalpis TaxID=7200 RepID=A0A1B0CX67_LUTLO
MHYTGGGRRFQPKEGKKLTYHVRVYFEFIEGWKSQRHTISLWRSIRLLEKRFRNTTEEITLNNKINIGHDELTPGVIYTFSLSAKDDKGAFKWQMPFLGEVYQEWLRTPGKTLYLPANVLKPGKKDKVYVKVLNQNQTETYTEGSMNLHVLKRDFFVILTPMNLSIGINRRITYKLAISQSFDDEDLSQITWECKNLQDNENCPNFEGASGPMQEVSFPSLGDYQVTAQITSDDVTQTLSSFVTVDPRIIASVQFPDIKPKPLISWRSLKLSVVVNDVIPQCHLHWTTVNPFDDNQYGYIDNSYFPSKIIPNLEENFLSDIVEISNATYSEDFILEVPEQFENFSGIEPEKVYVFRLLVTCPEPLEEWNAESEGNITSFADLVLISKQPPITRPMEVFPEEGVALKTLFTIFTGTASDTPDDYPMRYLFQYQIGRLVVDLEEFYENMQITTELPYSEEPIRIFYRVCDTRNACSRTEGPSIHVNLPEDYSREEFQFKLDKIKSMFYRTDYDSMFSTSVACILTFKEFPDKTFYEELKSLLIRRIQEEVSRLQANDESIFVSELKILSFVKYGKLLLELLGVNDTKLKEDLLTLLSTIRQERSDSGTLDENNLIMKRSIEPDKAEMRKLSEEDLSSEFKLDSANFSLELFRGNGFQVKVRNFTIPSLRDQGDSGYVILRNVFNTNSAEEYCASRITYSSDFVSGDVREEIFDLTLFAMNSTRNKAKLLTKSKTEDERYSLIFLQMKENRFYEDAKCVIWSGMEWTDETCSVLSTSPSNIECQCSELGFIKIFTDSRFEEDETYENTTINPFTLTTEATIDEVVPQGKSTIVDPQIGYIKSDIIHTEPLVITTNIKDKVKSVSDIFTFSPIVNNEADEVITVKTIQRNSQENSSQPHEDLDGNIRESNLATTIGFIVVGIFCLIIIIIITFNLYFIRKKNKMKHMQEMQIMSTESRVQSEEIKYARFYDEKMLLGNQDNYN